MADQKETSLSIPEDLAEKLNKRAEEGGFKSLSAYVTYILRQVLSRINMEEKQKDEAFGQKKEEEIKQKLRDLGYLE